MKRPAPAWNFAAELAEWGPTANRPAPAAAQAAEYTRRLASTHYENFPVLSLWAPQRLHQHFANVYAYCRWSDDLADEVGDASRALELLDWWRGELELCYAGRPRHLVMIALQPTIERFEIPRGPFLDLLKAFRRDQRQTRYQTFADLLDYCRCSADPVGRLVLYLCERNRPEYCEWSDAVCTGLQLANFCQDVAVDARRGRIYLPAEDRERFRVPDSDLTAGGFSTRFRDLMAFEVERAERYLQFGSPLARRMPGRLKLVIALFGQGGLGILRAIRRAGYNVLDRRPKLSKADFVGILGRTAVGLLPRIRQPEKLLERRML